MQLSELEQLIDERSKKQIEEAKTSIKSELGGIATGIDEKKFNEAVEKAVKEITEQNKKDLAANSNMLVAFEKANAEKSVKGLREESVKSVVNEMIGSALFAMEQNDVKNVKQLNGEQILASAKKFYPNSKALHSILETKALNASVPSEGGFTVPVAFSQDYISLLYANTLLDKLGVTKVPLINGNFSIPKMTKGSKASWMGETKKIKTSQAEFGEVNLKAKKLGVLTPISNSLLRYSGVGLDTWIANDLMEGARQELDDAFLHGSGTEYTPRGIENITGIQTTGSASTALAVDTPINMVALLEQANVPMANVKWLLSPTGKAWLAGKAFTSGPFAWAAEMAQSKQLDGYDFLSSSNVKYDGTGTPKTDMWIGDWSQFIWGVGYDLNVEMSREGTYTDADGNIVSAFQNDLTLIRLVTEHDFAVRQPKAFVKGTFKQNA